jgi:hypothetical protein
MTSCSKRIRNWQPRIGDIRITSKEQLRTIIAEEYPGFRGHQRFDELLADAELHLDLLERLRGQRSLRLDEVRQFVEDRKGANLQAGRRLITAYTRHASRPRLYWLIDRALSKTEARARIKRVHEWNRGICCEKDVQDQLATYYPSESLNQSPGHGQRMFQVSQYFRAIELMKDGGLYSDVAKVICTHRTSVLHWLSNRKRPELVHLARGIPKEDPGPGYRWLPKRMKLESFDPTDFVAVPVKVSDWEQISSVICQLASLNNPTMQRWRERFGPARREEACSYVLGMLISDAAKQSSYSSMDLRLHLSKVYPWSEQVGEATCYYLGKLGVVAKRVADTGNAYQWVSERTPLLAWMVRSGLRIVSGTMTTEWILRAPEDIRLRFLHGLNDGDGYASTKAQVMGNASEANGALYVRLLESFGVRSRDAQGKVQVESIESIKRAAKLPFFLHATGRQSNAEKIAKMLEARKETSRRPIPEEVVQRMVELRRLGKSYGETAEIIYEEYNRSYSKSSIRYRVGINGYF